MKSKTDYSAFADCKNLTSVTLPDTLVNVFADTFMNTPWLSAKQEENPLVIVNHILIDAHTCTGDVIIPDGVKIIGGMAFGEGNVMANLDVTSVTIPDSVTKIEACAFTGCENLTSVTLSDNITNLEKGAFSHCSGLTSVTLPKNLKNIGNFAFSSCDSLTSVIIPDGVTNIGSDAFYGCHALTSVTIPDSVTDIGINAFTSTPWLKAKQAENPLVTVNHILIDGTTCTGNVIIPDVVTSIAEEAFYNSELTSVIIPETVTSIGENAFQSCSKLTSVTIENADCEISEGIFSTFSGTIYGYPRSAAQTYAETHNYKFESLISSEPETESESETETIPETEPETQQNTVNPRMVQYEDIKPDINHDGILDASDAAILLTYAAEFGAGNVADFVEFMEQNYAE